ETPGPTSQTAATASPNPCAYSPRAAHLLAPAFVANPRTATRPATAPRLPSAPAATSTRPRTGPRHPAETQPNGALPPPSPVRHQTAGQDLPSTCPTPAPAHAVPPSTAQAARPASPSPPSSRPASFRGQRPGL